MVTAPPFAKKRRSLALRRALNRTFYSLAISSFPDKANIAFLGIAAMAMEYINYIKAKTHISTSKKAETPVLSEEDEQFLNHITSDAKAPPLPARPRVLDLPVAGEARGNDAQIALMNGAQNIPLPDTPNEVTEEPPMLEASATALEDSTTSAKEPAPGW